MEIFAHAKQATPMCSQYVWGMMRDLQKGKRVNRNTSGKMMQKLQKEMPTAIFIAVLGVKMVTYLKGKQMVTQQSNAMAIIMAESRTKLKWRKNICLRQPGKAISWAPIQKMLSVLGTPPVDKMRSVIASMDRKQNTGSWRLHTTVMT